MNYRGDHRSVRAFRRLGADRMDLWCGPIRPTIVRGMRLWQYVLADNDWGISYDIHFHDTTRQVYRAAKSEYLLWRPVKGNSHIEASRSSCVRR